MNDLALSVRLARPEDAADLARIYIDAWQDTYAGIIPHPLLAAMSHKRHAARWLSAIKSHEKGTSAVLIAEDAQAGPIGLASLGAARDAALGFEGEIYTLYVDPSYLGLGTGRALMEGAFEMLRDNRMRSCLVWAHARNNACFFYEAVGGRPVASRTTRLMGELMPETGYGWRQLATRRQARPVKS